MHDFLSGVLYKLLLIGPSISAALILVCVAITYCHYISKHYGGKLNSADWTRKNRLKSYFLCFWPVIAVLIPAIEELLFRAPLVLFFDKLTLISWIFIVISSVYFAYMHWETPFAGFTNVNLNEQIENDDIGFAVQKAKLEHPEPIQTKITRVSIIFPFSIFCGYLSIAYQSVWASIIFHSLWNTFWPLFVFLIALIIGGALKLLSIIFDKYDDWKWKRKRRKRLLRDLNPRIKNSDRF